MTDKAWSNYEEAATYLLNRNAKEFGLDKVEGKQSVLGLRSGTSARRFGMNLKSLIIEFYE